MPPLLAIGVARGVLRQMGLSAAPNHGMKTVILLSAFRKKPTGYLHLLYFSLGDFVIHPERPDWGIGQVQSIVGMNVTVNFEHAGKQMINCNIVALNAAPRSTK